MRWLSQPPEVLASSAHKTGVHLPLGWADKAVCLMDLYAAYRGELWGVEGEYRWVTLTAGCYEERIPPGQHSALSDAQAALALLKALASYEPGAGRGAPNENESPGGKPADD